MLQNFQQRWKSITAFLRFEYLTGAIIPSFFGAVISGVPLSANTILMILGVACAFHLFVVLLNDVVDLPLDRTNPARAHYPLVKGTVSREFALTIALLQIPSVVILIYLQSGSVTAYISIGLAFVALGIYNLWNKVTPFPIVMDLAQGIGFCAPVIYGASISGSVSRVAWIVFVFGAIWMMLLNLLGGIRDIHNDIVFGVNTTPISLGVRPAGEGTLVPSSIRNYGYTLHWLTLSGGLMVFVFNDLHYPYWLNAIMIGCCLVYGILSTILLTIFFKAALRNKTAMVSAGYLYLGISSLILLIVVCPLLPLWVIILSFLFFIFIYRNYKIRPLLSFRFTQIFVREENKLY